MADHARNRERRPWQQRVLGGAVLLAFLLMLELSRVTAWSWLVAAALMAIAAAHLVHTSQRFAKSLEGDYLDPANRPVPSEVADALTELSLLGFKKRLHYVRNDRVGAFALSTDGAIIASVAEGPQELSRMFVTRWDSASMTSTREAVATVRPDEHAHVRPKAELAELIEGHRDSIRILSGRYGTPRDNPQLSLAQLNETLAESRRTFSRDRYRLTARALAHAYFNAGYRPPIRVQLMLSMPAWVGWAIVLVSWAIVTATWVWVISDPDPTSVLLGLVMALLMGGHAINGTIGMARRRQFVARASMSADLPASQ